jgi:predicted tellurium resistance membrane protein TerC
LAQRTSVTSVEHSPEVERRTRFIQYTVAMIIRVLCIFLAVAIDNWLRWVFMAGAILLPYFAVVAANSVGSVRAKTKAVAVTPLQISSKDFIDASPK